MLIGLPAHLRRSRKGYVWEESDWIIMELVRGQTLRQRLQEKGPFGLAMAARLGCEIAEGLAEAHEFGILHRDLKAANVMVM